LSALVRTRVGRSLMPDSSTKTISRLSRTGFFLRAGHDTAFPATHGFFFVLDGALLRILHAKAQGAKDSPDLRLAELDVVQPFDKHSHTLERPKLCTKAVLGRLLQNGSAQTFQLGLVQSGRTASSMAR
jgi:hypothetical protein